MAGAAGDGPPVPEPVPDVVLANGVRIPVVGFGTAFFKDDVRRPELAWRALTEALAAGYRHIDSAIMYGNERQVGSVLGQHFMDGRLTREDVFITTKVGHPPTQDFPDARTDYLFKEELSAYDGVMQEAIKSLDNLGLGYVDLLLIHWPGLFESSRYPKDWAVEKPPRELARRKRVEMWAALERLYEMRVARAIGVSNFTKEHLEDILPSCKVRPMMNQIEVHPYLCRSELVDYCQGLGITVTAYSPLAGGKVSVVSDPAVVELAAKKGVPPGRLVLSWLVQRGIVVIPKSSSPVRMAENLCIAQNLLSPEEMGVLAGLDRGVFTCPDPSAIH